MHRISLVILSMISYHHHKKHTIEANYVDADYAAADGDGDGDDYDYVDNLII